MIEVTVRDGPYIVTLPEAVLVLTKAEVEFAEFAEAHSRAWGDPCKRGIASQ
jgi:hypothetical protein